MSVKNTVTASFTMTNSIGKASLSYDKDTLAKTLPLTITYSGMTVSFATVADYRLFVAEIITPLLNAVNSVSGAGVGYSPASVGNPGADSVVE